MKYPRILLLGWEFPPVISGGLGVVTEKLFSALRHTPADISLMLPQFVAGQVPAVAGVLRLNDNAITYIPTRISTPYATGYDPSENKKDATPNALYGANLMTEVDRFADDVVHQCDVAQYDLIHAQDWITAEAAVRVKATYGVPFVLHIHATQIDRMGDFAVRDEVFRREQYAMQQAEKVITVSEYTKRILVEQYGIAAEKVTVVYNAYFKKKLPVARITQHWNKPKDQFWVLFIGRLTIQKGPEYFVRVAEKVVEIDPSVHFYIAGDGDMRAHLEHMVQNSGTPDLLNNVHFTGFVNNERKHGLFRFSDACIIPSVSEPFGLTALEAVSHKTPLILSKTCGAAEVLPHTLLVDFWDVDKMVNYVLQLKQYPALRRTLRQNAKHTLPQITWETQAEQVVEIYTSVLKNVSHTS